MLSSMSKLNEKLSKFNNAITRLEEAILQYEECGLSSCRDGIIQRFEFCTELAWKSAREYLTDEGYIDLNSPKSVMRQAYTSNLIDNEEAWLDLLYSRNLTSHIYDEATADEIFGKIKECFLYLFKDLAGKLSR